MTITETAKLLAQLETTGGNDTLYTVSDPAVQTLIKTIHVVNIGGAGATISIWHGGTTPGNMILPAVTLASGEFAIFSGSITMRGVDTLYANGDAGAIAVTVHGIEFS